MTELQVVAFVVVVVLCGFLVWRVRLICTTKVAERPRIKLNLSWTQKRHNAPVYDRLVFWGIMSIPISIGLFVLSDGKLSFLIPVAILFFVCTAVYECLRY